MIQSRSGRLSICQLVVIVLLLARGALGIAYSIATPLGEAPDEADHYAYAAYILEHGQLPVGAEMTQGKHPPLYYLVAAMAGQVVGGSPDRSFLRANPDMAFGPDSPASNFFVHTSLEDPPWRDGVLTMRAGRFVSILAGLILIFATYLLGRSLWPRQPAIALGGAAFAAFLPEALFVGGAMSNDMFAALWSTLALLGTAKLLRHTRQLVVALLTGLCLGFAFVSKASTASLAVVVVLALLLSAWRESGGRRSVSRALAAPGVAIVVTGLAALIVAAPWLWRNWRLYGDPFGWSLVLATIDKRTAPLALADGVQLLRGWWLSFWGKFGGAGHISLPTVFYVLWGALGVAAVGGWLASLARRSGSDVLREPGIGGWVLLAGAPLLTAAGIYSYSGLALGTDQGRLLFPTLAPLALLIFGGLSAWFPRRWQGAAAGGFALGMALIAMAALIWGLLPPFAQPPEPTAAQVGSATPVNKRVGPLLLSGIAWDTPATGQVTLYWQAAERTSQDLRTDMRALDGAGALLWEWKRSPGAGRFSTDRWATGRMVADAYRVPAEVAGRVASLQVGLRPFPEGPWLPFDGLPAGQLLALAK